MAAHSLRHEIKTDVDQVLEAILYLYTERRRVTKELARRADLTGPQLTVVKLLEQSGGVSLSELSERIRAQNSTVTGIVDRMEREGLVVRERSKEDRRVVFIRLTTKGRRLAEDIPVEPMDLFRGALQNLPQTETRELVRILGKVARCVQETVKEGVGIGAASTGGATSRG